MKKINTIAFLIAFLMFSGLTKAQVANNYATTTEYITNLKQGMTLDEISKTLNSQPKDVYSNIENKTKIITYKYRLNFQKVPAKAKNDEQYLRGGEPVYKEEGNLYVVLNSDDNKLIYFITDNGRKLGKKELNEALKIKLNS